MHAKCLIKCASDQLRPQPPLGAPWVDLVCLLLESDLGPHDPQQLFTGHPLARGVDEQAVDGFLIALASYWTHAAALPVGATPWIRARQERSRQATPALARPPLVLDTARRPHPRGPARPET